MTPTRLLCKPAVVAKARGLGRQFLHWLRARDETERYLGAATDHADLERRIRDLERMNSGPSFVTFNH
jgi:hypothetical protein